MYPLFFWLGQAFALAIIGLGLFLVFVQTPKIKAQYTWKIALAHYAEAQKLEEPLRPSFYRKARDLGLQALAMWPYDADIWFGYANLDAKMHGSMTDQANQAFAIAAKIRPELADKIQAHQRKLQLSFGEQAQGVSP